MSQSISTATAVSYAKVPTSYVVATDAIAAKLKPLAGSDQRFPARTKVFVLDGTIGSKEMFLVVGDSDSEQRTATFKTLPTSPNGELKTSIKPTTPQEAASIADCVKEICGMIEQYRVSVVPVLESTSTEQRSAIKSANPASKGSDSENNGFAEWKAAGRFVTAYADLANSGTGRFVSETLKTLMALNKTCQLSLNLYS